MNQGQQKFRKKRIYQEENGLLLKILTFIHFRQNCMTSKSEEDDTGEQVQPIVKIYLTGL